MIPAALGELITLCLIVIHHLIHQLSVSIKGFTTDSHAVFHCRHRGKSGFVWSCFSNISKFTGNNDDVSQESDSHLPSAQAAGQKSSLMRIRGNIST